MARKKLWMAVILLNLVSHLVLAQDCKIVKPRKKKYYQNIWETIVKCKDVGIKLEHELDQNGQTEKQVIEFFCQKNLRNRCENHDGRCKLPDLNEIKSLFNKSDFNNITELEFRDFQLKLPGDVFKIFPKVVTLYLRFTDPEYESGGTWPDNLTLLETYSPTNLTFPKVSSIKELEIERPCKCNGDKDFNLADLNFTNLDNLEYLEFFRCPKLTRLPPNAFRSAKKLKKLELDYNKLKTIDKDALKGLTELEVIDLSKNYKLTELPKGFFGNAPKLQEIDISATNLSLTESNFGQNQLQKITIFEAEDMIIRDEMGFFEMINGMVNLQTLELRDTRNLTFNSSRIKMIPSSIKDFKGTFCCARIYEESCDFAFAMKNLNNASTIECFEHVRLKNGTKLMEKIKRCDEEKAEDMARFEAVKAAELGQRNGIISAFIVLVFLFCCFLLTWQFAIVHTSDFDQKPSHTFI